MTLSSGKKPDDITDHYRHRMEDQNFGNPPLVTYGEQRDGKTVDCSKGIHALQSEVVCVLNFAPH